jgi:hypothetical protein
MPGFELAVAFGELVEFVEHALLLLLCVDAARS